MKYAIYTRCSTEEQSNGFSHEYQINGLKSSHKLADGECIGIYSDTISGTTFDRPELDGLIQYCRTKRGAVNFVFVYRWDRFGRDMTEAFRVMKTFHDLGVEINCPDSWVNFKDPNWPLLQGINMGMAQSESLKISDRTRDGLYQANVSGFFTGKAPTGYVRHIKVVGGKQRSVLVPHPQKSKYIQEVFKLAADGTPVATIRSMYGKKLDRVGNSFYQLLNNIIYTGHIHVAPYKSHPAMTVKGLHQPLISLSLYERVQNVLAGKRNHYAPKDADDNIFYAKTSLVCDVTGQHMTAYWSKGKTKRYPYYSTPRVKGTVLNANSVHASIDDVMDTLKIIDIPPTYIEAARAEFMKAINQGKENASILKREMEKNTRKLETVEKDYLDGTITAQQFNRISTQIDLMNSEIQEKLAQIHDQTKAEEDYIDRLFEHLFDLGKLFRTSDTVGKEKILKAFFPSGITVDRNYNVRTPEINEIIKLFYSESGIYDYVEDKKKGENLTFLPEGG